LIFDIRDPAGSFYLELTNAYEQESLCAAGFNSL
jgi:hypothetical protein